MLDDKLVSYQARAALPVDLVEYLDGQSNGVLTAISWIEPHRLRFIAHFAIDESRMEDRVFRHRGLGKPKGARGLLRR
jgi:hypothetical protein